MPQNYSGRVTAILSMLLIALLAIFWPSVAAPRSVALNRNVPVSAKLNLKPGIDIVGGTSLLYEIKQPEGVHYSPTLAEDVTKALKQRVDPQGVLNLIWRPQNPNRLEIQMPLSAAGGEAAQRQKDLEAARQRLDATNVSVSDVVDAIEQKNGKTRADLAKAPAGDPVRKKIVDDLVVAYDAIQKAQADRDVDAAAKAQEQYEKLQTDLAATNVAPAEVDRVLGLKASRAAKLAELKQKASPAPERAAALDAYVKAKESLAKGGGGLESAADLKRLLRGSGVLEFHILPGTTDPDLGPGGYRAWADRLQKDGPRVQAGDKFRWFEVERPEEFKGSGVVLYNDRSYILGSIKSDESLDRNTGQWKLTRAYKTADQTGVPCVGFEFDTMGGQYFANLTTKHRGRQMAIMLDGRVISAPNIQSAITGGSGVITGGTDGFTGAELDYLIRMLSAGSLPAQLNEEPISERTVGPQLGEDNLHSGLLACGLGLVVVAIFLVGYYHLAGVIAFGAVLMNIVLILGSMAAINATFTLPGIAAIVLTIGTAVDANVLIFERLREEQHRGLSLRMAVRNAYDRAFGAIFDSNMTTVITSFFLILFGTEEVKGFGITLIIGIIWSMFTALLVTKTVFGILIDLGHIKKLGSLPLSYPKWDRMLKPHFDWMRVAWVFYAFSAVAIVAGIGLFAHYARKGQVLDIEFASGTAVTFETKTARQQETVRGWIEAESRRQPDVLPVPSVQRIGKEGTTWEVTTPNADARRVRDAVVAAIGDNLNAEQPSKFEGVGQPLSQVSETLVIPLVADNLKDEARNKWPGEFIPEDARKYPGGAAILLKNLEPPLTVKQITDRIHRQTLQVQTPSAGTGAVQAGPRDFTVAAYGGQSDKPVSNAVVLTGDPALAYDKDTDPNKSKWRDNVVAPMWALVNDGVNNPAKLQQVKNFDASVAADTQKDALIALGLSIVAIMAYIWVRFGNLKYGTATVVALLHDVLFTVAALGFAHLLAGNAIGDLFKLEPFRINLTVVAGILTIMGYSMIDTIVVFDRIREIRGKFGHVSRQVVNDAINQTLSRTLLTAGTTLVMCGIMYFIGGAGIHGFTFVLLIGILVGTYSSIAIASPILLLGSERSEEASGKPRSVGQLQRA